VGPDNGLLYPAVSEATDLEIVSLENPAYFRPAVSATFHGRDLFAPVAGHLSLGVPCAAFGPPVRSLQVLAVAQPLFTPDVVEGEVIGVDHFGNLVTNLPAEDLREWLAQGAWRLRVGRLQLTDLARTYADVPPGQPLALPGSHGYVEIAVNLGSAARLLGANSVRGLPVTVERL
jgi:hypothetical protein